MSTNIGAISQAQIAALTTASGIAGKGLGTVEEISQFGGKGMTIRIIPATGGTIISIKREDTYSSPSNLYVISEDQNIAEELGKIITLHYLKS